MREFVGRLAGICGFGILAIICCGMAGFFPAYQMVFGIAIVAFFVIALLFAFI